MYVIYIQYMYVNHSIKCVCVIALNIFNNGCINSQLTELKVQCSSSVNIIYNMDIQVSRVP